MTNTQKLLSFHEIISEKQFIIPDYQRGYSWEDQQVIDLIKDIENLLDKDHKHYTGTIVASPLLNKTEIFDLVDGQQRLTTLVILLMLISENYPEKYGHLKTQLCIKGGCGNERYLLKTNVETWDCFRTVIYENGFFLPEIKSHFAIVKAKEILKEWINNDPSKIDSIVKAILDRLGFLFFSPENTREIGIMFEVINNRGKQLSELEKIKNYFIYYSTIFNRDSLREKVNDKWGNIQLWLSKAGITSNDSENSFLRNCYIVFFDTNKQRSWYVYDELKYIFDPHVTNNEEIDRNVQRIKQFIEFLAEAALHYAFLFNKNGLFMQMYNAGIHKTELNKVLKRLRCHPTNASIMPLYLAGMSYLKSNPDFVLEFLNLIEKVNFRIYILPNSKIARADSKQGSLFFWAHELYRDRDWISDVDEKYFTWMMHREIKGNIFDYAKMQLQDFVYSLCPEETFVQSLTIDSDEAIDYYNWNGLRFFLASYEEALNFNRKETWDIEKILITRDDSKNTKNDYLSREHIWASQNRSDEFPSDCKEKRRLGNFVLIGLSSNIQLQNNDIEDKINFLIENASISTLQVKHLEDYLKKAQEIAQSRRVKRTKYFFLDIATSLIDQRENELIKFALERWRLPDEKFEKFNKVDSFEAENRGKKEYYILFENVD